MKYAYQGLVDGWVDSCVFHGGALYETIRLFEGAHLPGKAVEGAIAMLREEGLI